MTMASTPQRSADSGAVPLANVLMLGTAEWDSPIATNQHYVARELAQAANVTFVESLGLRRPTLRPDDLKRMASRVRRTFVKVEEPGKNRRPRPERTSIVSPLVLPIHRTPTYRLNRALLRRSTQAWLRSQGPRVLWTFTPVTYELEAMADIVVYHCVDLLGAFPGVDAVAVDRGERRLASRTSVAIATSKPVEDHLGATGFPRVISLPNVADVSVFSNASQPAADRRNAVLFSGNLTVHKLDLALLEAIAVALRGRGELLLAGPLAAGGGEFGPQLRRLEELGARYLGMLSPQQLAEVAGTCAVGLIPYAQNDYTQGVSPLKCFEYLSSGLAVLSTPLPAVVELSKANPHVVAAQAQDLPAELLRLMTPATDAMIEERVASAAGHGWAERGQVLRDLLHAQLGLGPAR